MEELLQINNHTVKMESRQNLHARHISEIKPEPNHLGMSLSKSIARSDESEDSRVKFRIVSTAKKSIAEESSMVKINDLSVKDTSLYEHSREDRDRSKSQRRRRIFS